MPDIFGAAISAGGGKVFAVIDITYPAGAACICTSGTKALTAPDTSGHWLAIIPNAGEWTVSSTASYGPVSEIVNVQDSKAYFVALGGTTFIYDNGEINIPFVGDISNEGYTQTVTTYPPIFEEGYFVLQGGTGYLRISGTQLAIDFTPFSTLRIRGRTSGGSGNAFSANVSPTKNYTQGLAAQFVQPASNSEFDISVDVENVTGEYYFSINSTSGSNSARSEVNEIWLE